MKVITIGRNEEHNDIVVNDELVSRNHLQMIMDDQGNYFVSDLNSTNGTFVNGRRITGQVPLQVTDELKIGNTVLSWQCYFNSQPNSGTFNTGQSYNQIPNCPVSQRPNSSPKLWLIFVIVGAVVLLLAGGGIGWKMYHDKKQKTELENELLEKDAESRKQQDLNEAKAEADQAEKEYAEAMQKAAEAQAEAERLERIAAQTNSKKDKDAAIAARKEADNSRKDMLEARKAQEEAVAAVKKMESKLHDMTEERNRANDEKSKAEKAKSEAEKSLKLTNEMQMILNNWNDLTAVAFCKSKTWSTKNARAEITVQFLSLNDNTKKQAMIDDMKAFKKKEDAPKPTDTTATPKKQVEPKQPESNQTESNQAVPQQETNN